MDQQPAMSPQEAIPLPSLSPAQTVPQYLPPIGGQLDPRSQRPLAHLLTELAGGAQITPANARFFVKLLGLA